MNINLSKFKKMSSDGKVTTLRHADGHEFKIAHKALSSKARAELDKMPMAEGGKVKKMAEGGDVKSKPVDDVPEPNKANAKAIEQGATESVSTKLSHSWQNLTHPKWAKGGSVSDPTQQHLIPGDKTPNKIEKEVVAKDRKRMAGGGEADKELPPIKPAPTYTPPPAPERDKSPDPSVKYLAEGGEDTTVAASDYGMDKMDEGAAPEAAPSESPGFLETAKHALFPGLPQYEGKPQVGFGGPDQHPDQTIDSPIFKTPEPEAPAEGVEGASGTAEAPAPAPAQPSGMSAADAMDKSGDYTKSMLAGLNMQQAGAETAAKAQMSAADAQARALNEGIKQQRTLMAHAQDIDAKADMAHNDLMKAVQDQKIDPNHYLGSMSTGQKIATTIGLLLGGIGSGLTGQPNLAAKFMDDQINNDIKAQESMLGKKVTLLTANMNMFKDKRAAVAATSAMMNGMVGQQLQLAAAKAQSPEAQARLMQMSGEFMQKAAQVKQQGKMFEFMSQAAKSGDTGTYIQALRMSGNKDMAEDLEKRYVPGVGVGSVPVPEAERAKLVARQDLQDKVMKLRQFAQQHAGSLNPATVKEGKALAGVVQDSYRQAAGQGVFREAEKNFVESLIPGDPTAFFNKWRVDPKLKAIESTNLSTLNGMKKAYGLRPQLKPTESAPILRKTGK